MINALFGFFWSAGSVAGPVVSGMLIGITGYDGLIVTGGQRRAVPVDSVSVQNEKPCLPVSRKMTWTRRRSPHGSPHGLAWRQPFLWPSPEGILFLLAHCC